MTVRTRAAILREQGRPFHFEEVTIDAPRNEEIWVRIIATGICHTDIAVKEGRLAAHYPCVLGHEGAGIVEKIGKKVSRVRPGEAVILSFNSCGSCKYCKAQHPAQCSKYGRYNFYWKRPDGSATIWDKLGNPIGSCFLGQSSFSYIALANERNAIPIQASEEELAIYASLGCGIQAGASTIFHELQPKGKAIAIFGVGPVGLGAVMAAKLIGAELIIAIDCMYSRLKIAKELGAKVIIHSNKKAKKIWELIGKVDFIVETTGSSNMIDQAMRSLSPQGKITLFGIPSDLPSEEVAPKSPSDEQVVIDSIMGNSNPLEFLPFLIESHKQGKFPLEKLIKKYPVSQINQAVRDSKKGSTIKPILVF
jgi:aryl-alcohol dehydrogenase